jgi:hypothetical protein
VSPRPPLCPEQGAFCRRFSGPISKVVCLSDYDEGAPSGGIGERGGGIGRVVLGGVIEDFKGCNTQGLRLGHIGRGFVELCMWITGAKGCASAMLQTEGLRNEPFGRVVTHTPMRDEQGLCTGKEKCSRET